MVPMKHEPNSISLETLAQSDYWVDRYGNEHELTSMTRGYLVNTREHLRRMAATMYSLELRRQEHELFIAELTGWDSGRDPQVMPRGQEAAEAWMENTPLIKAITALLDGTAPTTKKDTP